MKKIMILALSLITVGLFAGGKPEAEGLEPGRGFHGGPAHEREWIEGARISREAKEIAGTIVFGEEAFPLLRSEEGDLDLLVPPFAYQTLGIEDGTEVVLQGFLISGDNGQGDSFQAFRPVSGFIDGEPIDVEALTENFTRGHRRHGFGPHSGFPGGGERHPMGDRPPRDQ